MQGARQGADEGPVHTFLRILGILGIDLDINRQADSGNIASIWLSDEFRDRIDLMADSKQAIKHRIRKWVRRAMMQALSDRCNPTLEERYATINPNKSSRKDMATVSRYVDIESTTANLQKTKGTHKYALDDELSNSLKSIIAGSIRLGDRLHAANLIPSDQCDAEHCSGRHTTYHVFWECKRHKERRKQFCVDYDKVCYHARTQGSHQAEKHVKDIFSEHTFKVTGICPDDMLALVHDTRRNDIERVAEHVPEYKQMIGWGTDGLIFETINGQWYATVYTDGSLLDPNSNNFARAGWGFFVAKNHEANMSAPLLTPHPTVFRAELRAILHAMQVCAIPTIVRTDCKSAATLVHKIFEGEGFDKNHADADILQVISNINNKMCIVQWMPAHLDEEKNSKKKQRFLKTGGTDEHIQGNVEADELAKEGADQVPLDKDSYFRFTLRKWLTRIVQNFLVDVWCNEKSRMYGKGEKTNINDADIQAILDIEQIQSSKEDEEFPEDEDDFHGAIDFNGNEIIGKDKENGMPNKDDTDDTVGKYLQKTFPAKIIERMPKNEDFKKNSSQDPEKNKKSKDAFEKDEKSKDHEKYFPDYKDQQKAPMILTTLKVTNPWQYKQFPNCKATYTKECGKKETHTVKRYQWEPYQWFFEQLQWSDEKTKKDAIYEVSFAELAIAAHIMTNGATAEGGDFCIKTKIMKSAFQKFYKQKIKDEAGTISYNAFFKPVRNVKTLTEFGAGNTAGVSRAPFCENFSDIWKLVRIISWRAATEWRQNLNKQFGEDYHLPRHRIGTWKAEAILWAETMIDAKSDAKKDEKKLKKTPDPEKMLKKYDDPEKMLKKSGDPEKNQMKCFYGHTTTSLKDRRGRPRWLVSPCNWPGIPPGRTLCQACYEANYQAARKGHVAKINENTKKAVEKNGKDDECTMCAEDVIADFVQREHHIAWLRLWALSNESSNRCYGFCTARPPG